MTTIKEAENQIRSLLEKHIHRTINKHHEAFQDLLCIMEKQEQWVNKLHTIQVFRVTRSKLNKAMLLQVKVDNCHRWLTVSWRKSGGRKEIDPLQSSFRQSVRRQITAWKRSNMDNKKCVYCNVIDKRLEADHHEPSFKKLTTDFLERPINSEPPTEFDYTRRCGKKFSKKDDKFKKRWQAYHKKHMNLQWLCKKCNLGKSKD